MSSKPLSSKPINSKSTLEPQYNLIFDVIERHGLSHFGLMANESWNQDPKRTLFTLSRYKFTAKMLDGRRNVLEIGCGDAFGSRLVQQTVKNLSVADFDPIFIQDIEKRQNPNWPLKAFVHDILQAPPPGLYDAIYALDVLEHIAQNQEDSFLKHAIAALEPEGIMLIGMPSLESQVYASPQSRAGHVNCKTGDDLKALMERYFHSVFLFSMNDEVVHTGYQRMAHYLFALCAHLKQPISLTPDHKS